MRYCVTSTLHIPEAHLFIYPLFMCYRVTSTLIIRKARPASVSSILSLCVQYSKLSVFSPSNTRLFEPHPCHQVIIIPLIRETHRAAPSHLSSVYYLHFHSISVLSNARLTFLGLLMHKQNISRANHCFTLIRSAFFRRPHALIIIHILNNEIQNCTPFKNLFRPQQCIENSIFNTSFRLFLLHITGLIGLKGQCAQIYTRLVFAVSGFYCDLK